MKSQAHFFAVVLFLCSVASAFSQSQGAEGVDFFDSSWAIAFSKAHHPWVVWPDQWEKLRRQRPYLDILKSSQRAWSVWNINPERREFLQFEIMDTGSVGSSHTIGYISLSQKRCVRLQAHPYAFSTPPAEKDFVLDSKTGRDALKLLEGVKNQVSKRAQFEFTTIRSGGGYCFARLMYFDKYGHYEKFFGGPSESVAGKKAGIVLDSVSVNPPREK